MSVYFLVIKGNANHASIALINHGITEHGPLAQRTSTETDTTVGPQHAQQVRDWFNEDDPVGPDGYPVGALLHYSIVE